MVSHAHFSSTWLDVREPFDHAARSKPLMERLGAAVHQRSHLRILDLGSGTGSNMRALAPFLPEHQEWILVDHDPALLAEAKRRASRLVTYIPVTCISVTCIEADLTTGLDALLEATKPDVVTSAAFFDLVSKEWIERCVSLVAAQKALFYTALTYNGAEEWQPPHEADEAILNAFLHHQQSDKGFGPAAGARATQMLEQAFSRTGYSFEKAQSPWEIKKGDALLEPLVDGSAEAAGETGFVKAEDLEKWRKARRQAVSARIGHFDCLAVPERSLHL